MPKTAAHTWTFRTRFRKHAFGWKSQPAIQRIEEAVTEIITVAKADPLLAAEGAVIFIEKLSPAIEQIDSSSGAIGATVDHAIATLVPIIANATTDEHLRDKWLERVWQAYEADDIPYLESLGDHWGELCGSPDVASAWADKLMTPTKRALTGDADQWGYFKGSTNCLSALLAAKRYDELLKLLDGIRHKMWHYRVFGVKALVAMGRDADAIQYAEATRGLNESPVAIAQTCEAILLASGDVDEAYKRYGIVANEAGTYLAWFRAVAKKYPHKAKNEVLADLVAHTPGAEGKWFAAAKSAKLFDEAIELANRTPCAPQTLTRAARDFEEKNPNFALEAGMAALRWMSEGYGYEITSADVLEAYSHTMKAAENAGATDQTLERIRKLVSEETRGGRAVTRILKQQLNLG